MFWHLRKNWHFRHQRGAQEVSLAETVKGLQALLLDDVAAVLSDTLRQVFSRPVSISELRRLDIAFFQEGREQRVWRAQASLQDGAAGTFGLIIARSMGASHDVTQRDFGHLQRLSELQPRYCVRPYVQATAPVADGLAAYTVQWCESHKELVFEVSRDGGTFLINRPEGFRVKPGMTSGAAHRHFSLQASRGVWRRIAEVLCWYPGLRGVNVQAGDFIGRVEPDGQVDLKLTTGRQMASDTLPETHIASMLQGMITASGYLSDGRQPFDRGMSYETFMLRMRGVLERRFGDRAAAMARQQWELFRAGAFARQEDWLKEDCVLGTFDRWRADYPADVAWRETKRQWLAYAEAVRTGRMAPSWWFPAGEIPELLERLEQRLKA
jgi:hypothetical protein